MLAQARRCRHCGYRFDGARPPGPLDLIRPAATRTTLRELLSGWGVTLGDGEEVAFFHYCRMGSDDGYLLVTGERLIFFAQAGAAKLVDWPLQSIGEVEFVKRWRASRVHLTGPGGRVALRGIGAKLPVQRLADYLELNANRER